VLEPRWTPRQREVLDLLVRGYTNGQIADQLGISLDGAKWHVSEIITRLGVDSRDEAAEYWRHQNGLRMRFTRVLQAFFSSTTLKVAGGTAAVASMVIATVLVVGALRQAGNDATEPSAGNPPGDTADPGDSAGPGANPGNPNPGTTPGVPPNTTGEVVMGVDVVKVTVAQPSLPGTGAAYIIEKGCWQCDGEVTAYERVVADASGTTTTEEIFTAPSGYIIGGRFDPAGKEHFISVCSQGYCGGVGQISADARSTIYRSTDGGTTWEVLKSFAGSAVLGIQTAQGPLVVVQEENQGPVWAEVLTSGQQLTPPAPGYLPYGDGGVGFAWVSRDYRTLLMPDGSPLISGDLGGHKYADSGFQFISLLPSGDAALVSWWHGGSPATLVSYAGVVRNGQLERVFEMGEMVLVGAWLSPELAVGNMAMEAPAGSAVPGGMASQPVVFNLVTGEIIPLELYGPLFTDKYTGRNQVVGVQAIP
jgi:DNA-binding CsgD family transcriptional regulator